MDLGSQGQPQSAIQRWERKVDTEGFDEKLLKERKDDNEGCVGIAQGKGLAGVSRGTVRRRGSGSVSVRGWPEFETPLLRRIRGLVLGSVDAFLYRLLGRYRGRVRDVPR